jgi:transcriptional regulator of acetoin/glycerol metabolism
MTEVMARASEAWRSYAATGKLRPELLRPAIYRSWERAHAQHVSPRRRRPEVWTRLEFMRLVDRHAELIGAARPYLAAISRAAGSMRHGICVAGPDGTLLDQAGDTRSLLDDLPPLGTLMDEAHAGANGIGTPLSEGRYTEVLGAEHFVSGLQAHACYGFPLRGEGERPIGVLCLSTLLPGDMSHLRSLLRAASLGIEAELRALALKRTLAELKLDASHTAHVLTLLHQDVVQSHAAALLQFELGAARSHDERGELLVAAASESLERYLRHARTWQLASGLEPELPMSVRELFASAVELLQPEAHVLRVKLTLDDRTQGEHGPSTHATPQLARLVLLETLSALRSVGANGEVRVGFRGEGRLHWHSHSADHALEVDRSMPLQRAS